MSSADLFDDTWPHTHGTPDGFDNGCKSSACPAADAYGLSCKQAKTLSRSDYRYQRLAKTGATVAQIADELGLYGTGSAPTPKTIAKNVRKPEAHAVTEDVTAAADDVIAVGEPIRDVAEVGTTVEALAAAAQLELAPSAEPTPEAKPTPSTREIRVWAREKGYDVADRGIIANEIVEHYWEAHGLLDPTGEPNGDFIVDTTALAEAVAESEPVPQETADPTAPEPVDAAAAEYEPIPRTAAEGNWRKTIANQVRRSCTLDPREDGTTHRDDTILAVADWIENPPLWAVSPNARPEWATDDLVERIDFVLEEVAESTEGDSIEDIIVVRDMAADLLEHIRRIAQTSTAPAGPRPEWSTVALSEDLGRAIAERDRARDLAARLEEELHRLEAARELDRQDAAAIITTARHDANVEHHARETLTHAVTQLTSALRTTEKALELALTKWDEATRRRERASWTNLAPIATPTA